MDALLEPLRTRHPLPLDLRDACENFSGWVKAFDGCMGLILLVLMLKTPLSRSRFVSAFQAGIILLGRSANGRSSKSRDKLENT
jgi:hypothetical protein